MRKYAAKITSLKLLNRHFPEAKVHGVPKGFPSGRSLAVKAEWCRGQAVRLLVEEFKADIRVNPITGTDIMMEAILRCVGPPNRSDPEGEKIRDYLQTLLY
jgi:hypothetical protein